MENKAIKATALAYANQDGAAAGSSRRCRDSLTLVQGSCKEQVSHPRIRLELLRSRLGRFLLVRGFEEQFLARL